jgi:hypothetical protein
MFQTIGKELAVWTTTNKITFHKKISSYKTAILKWKQEDSLYTDKLGVTEIAYLGAFARLEK